VTGMKCFACFELIERLCDYVHILVWSFVHLVANSCFSVFDFIGGSANLVTET
jgi:hypothetical protein